MNLDQIQRAMFNAVRQPLTPGERMREKTLDGRPLHDIAEQIIKPNDRLTSFERLEIYNRQYWFRIISSMADDFDGLNAILGERAFQKLVIAYLIDCPSQSFTLRNLGSRLESWLSAHLNYVAGVEDLALDMVRLEWAEIEAFDGEARPKVSADDLARLGADPALRVQPYVRLLELKHPAHDLLLKLRERRREDAPVRKVPARSLPKPQPTFLAVHRSDSSVYFKDLEAPAFAMLREFQNGSSVSAAMDAADWGERNMDEIASSMRHWFANWASLGWFCKAE